MVKFNKGDVVRYDGGQTALMRLEEFIDGRWYGVQFFGYSENRHPDDLTAATVQEIVDFETSDSGGRLRDFGGRLAPGSEWDNRPIVMTGTIDEGFMFEHYTGDMFGDVKPTVEIAIDPSCTLDKRFRKLKNKKVTITIKVEDDVKH